MSKLSPSLIIIKSMIIKEIRFFLTCKIVLCATLTTVLIKTDD